MSQASLFDQTAENRARNKTILWWVLNLAYEKDGDDYKEVFQGADQDEKLASYDRYEEQEDDFIDEMLKKFSYVVSFWFITKADSQEELDVLLKSSEEEDKEEEKQEPSELEKSAGEEDKPLGEGCFFNSLIPSGFFLAVAIDSFSTMSLFFFFFKAN